PVCASASMRSTRTPRPSSSTADSPVRGWWSALSDAEAQAQEEARAEVFAQAAGRSRKALVTAGIRDLDGLLRHLPHRWIDPGTFTDIRGLEKLPDGEDVVLHVTVVDISSRRMQNRKGQLTTVTVTDNDRTTDAVFFNQQWLVKSFEAGS